MSAPVVPPLPPPIPSVPSPRATRTRRIISIALSCVTIVGASAALVVQILDPGFFLLYNTESMWLFSTGRLRTLLRASVHGWIFLALISLLLLIKLPRPTRTSARFPKPLAILAMISSGACFLYWPLCFFVSLFYFINREMTGG